METIRCIICSKQKKSSLEHIIPEALGNKKLITKNVCEECNNKLGEKIDFYLTDDFLYKLLRKKHGFTGKKGNEIKVFDNVLKDTKEDLYDVNEKENIVKFRPITKKIANGYVSKAETLKDAEDSAKKKLKRLGKTSAQLETILGKSIIIKTELEPPIFDIEFKIDMDRIYLAILKIAYEYACEKLGDVYFADELGQALRNELHEVIFNDKHINHELLKQNIMSAPYPIIEMVKDYKENMKDIPNEIVHIIMLHKNEEDELICQIYMFLDPTKSYVVKLSNSAEMYLKEKATFIDLVLDNGNILNF